MKKIYLSLLAVACYVGSIAQETTVFKSSEDGYASYRIPAIIKTKNGDLMAIAEGRVDHTGDYGNVDIVRKISNAQSTTWCPWPVLAQYVNRQPCNPAAVIDLLDRNYKNGRIFLFYNTGNNHEREV